MIKNGRHDLDCLASPRNRRLHFETLSVHEIFNSQTVQKGEVNVLIYTTTRNLNAPTRSHFLPSCIDARDLSKKNRPVLRPACPKKGRKVTINNYAVRSLRKERMAPMPNGRSNSAPAATVEGSGMGVRVRDALDVVVAPVGPA